MPSVYRKQGKLAEAESKQLAALDVDEDYHAARYALGNLLVDRGRLEDAERQFEILVTKAQGNLAEYGFARLAAKNKDAKRVAGHLTKVLDAGARQPLLILDDSAFKGLWGEKEMKVIFTRLSTVTSTAS